MEDVDRFVDPEGEFRAIDLAWLTGAGEGAPWLLVESSVSRDVDVLAGDPLKQPVAAGSR